MRKSLHIWSICLAGLLCFVPNILLCNVLIFAAEGAEMAIPLSSANDAAFYRYTSADALAAEVALAEVTAQDDPETIYNAFNEFARTHFGAASEPLVYEIFGTQLTFVESGAWQHISENSASLAWETNPAYSYVEYGLTLNMGESEIRPALLCIYIN